MCSSDEFLSLLGDYCQLARVLKEKSNLTVADSTFMQIAHHFLGSSVSIEGLAVQRNLYGRPRISLLNQCELDLFILNVKECLISNSSELMKSFLQYLHNINRLLPDPYINTAYLCALIVLPNRYHKNIIACIICAYAEKNTCNDVRFDLIINGLYIDEDGEEDNPWVDQLARVLIEKDKQWLRKYYLEMIYTKELLHAIDTHDIENVFHINPIKSKPEESTSMIGDKLDWSQTSKLDELHSKLFIYIQQNFPCGSIQELALFHLLSLSDNHPDDLHTLFSCSLISLISPTNYSKLSLQLFRRLILLINNYYVHQHDLLDDNRYRIMLAFLVSKFLCEVHRRRSKSEHEWYRLYVEVPNENPLPTFDLFSDLLCLLAVLCYNNIDCQNQVRKTSGTIEAILSMTQIDLNQPKAPACVTWLLKCLTETNEENRNYIKQIK